jgi:peptidoglycan/LPS O-acetylase OafA/YrhL
MFTHFDILLDRHNLVQHIVRAVFDFGWVGVDIFFVLSGFLITGILLNSRGAENYFSAFYARRVLRIFPLYYFSLLVVFLVAMPHLHMDSPPPAVWKKADYFLYIQNWFEPAPWLGQYWTLAIEEQFYLIWPLVIYFSPRERIPKIVVGAAAGALALRLTMIALDLQPQTVMQNTFGRMDALLMGAACSCLVRDRIWVDRLRRVNKWLWAAPLAVFPPLYLAAGSFSNKTRWMGGIGFSLVDLSCAAVLLALVTTIGTDSHVQRFFTSRAMRAMGKYSYSAYIWHDLVWVVVRDLQRNVLHRTPPWYVNIPLMIALTLLVSVVSYVVIERPFLSLKRYFKPRMPEVVASYGLAHLPS